MLSAPGDAEPAALPTATAEPQAEVVNGDGEGQDVATAPPAADTTPTVSATEVADEADDADERYHMDAPTPSAEPGIGGGAPLSGTMEPTSDDWVGFVGEATATPTPAEVGEEASEPVADEGALDREAPAGEVVGFAPLWVWRVVEIGLGLGALVLAGATVWAWRARHR